MKNTLKKTLQVTTGIVGSIIGTAAVVKLLIENKYSKKNVENKIRKVWSYTSTIVMDELHLKQIPELAFDTEDNEGVMYTCVRHATKGFSQRVVRSETDYIIHINTDVVIRLLKGYSKLTLRYFSNLDEIVIKQLLLHESRHLWQAESGFYNGTELLFRNLRNIGIGYGDRNNEKDANEWALSMANGKKEKVVFEAQKAMQESIDDIFGTKSKYAYKSRQKVRKVFWSFGGDK